MNIMKKLDVLRIDEAEINLPSKGLSIYARLEVRRPNKEGKYPIRIRVLYKSDYRDYGTKQVVSREQFESILGKRPKIKEANIKIQIIALLKRGYKVLMDMEQFSYDEFKELFFNKRNNDKDNIYNWYIDKINELNENGQLGTSDTYLYSMNSLKAYNNSEALYF